MVSLNMGLRTVAGLGLVLTMIAQAPATPQTDRVPISPILRTINVVGADAIAVDEHAHSIFVVGNGAATMLNSRSGGVLATAPVGTGPYVVAVDDRNDHVLVASDQDTRAISGTTSTAGPQSSVTMLDAHTGAELRVLALPGQGIMPNRNFVVDAQRHHAFIATNSSGNVVAPKVTELDTNTDAVVRVVPFSDQSQLGPMALDPPHNRLYTGQRVVDVATGRLSGGIRVGGTPLVIIGATVQYERLVGVSAGCSAIRNGLCMTDLYALDGQTHGVIYKATIANQAWAWPYAFDAQTGRLLVLGSRGLQVFDAMHGMLLGGGSAITGDVQSGSDVVRVVYDVRLQRAYVVSSLAGTPGQNRPQLLTVLDARSAAILTTAVAGTFSYSEQAMVTTRAVVDAATGLIFVANSGDKSVSVLPAAFGLPGPIHTTRLRLSPTGIAVDMSLHRAVVISSTGNRASLVDTRTGKLLSTVPVGLHPVAVVVDGSEHRAFVANYRSASVSVLDTRRDALLRTVQAGRNPTAIAVDEAGRKAFVVNANSYSVSVLDAHSGRLMHTLRVGAAPIAIAIDPRLHHAFVVNRDSNTVSIIDTRTDVVSQTVTVPTTPDSVAVDSATERVFVGSEVGKSISVLDARTGAILSSASVAPGVLVVNTHTSRVFVVPQPAPPAALSHAGQSGQPVQNSSPVSILDAQSGAITPTVSNAFSTGPTTVGAGLHAAAVDEQTGQVIVTNAADETVSVLDGATGAVIGAVPVGYSPVAVAVDSSAHHALVLNSLSHDVSILAISRPTL